MDITRRQFSVLGASAFLAAVVDVQTAGAQTNDNTLISGDTITQNLDPHQLQDVLMLNYAQNAYDTLFRYQDNPATLVPWLAESADLASDNLTWTVKLKPGVKFHDGSEMTADDVVYSFKRVLTFGMAPSGPFSGILLPENVTSPEPGVVQFVLERPYAPFYSALPTVYIVNSRLVAAHEENGDMGKTWLLSNEAGSGAYKLVADRYAPQQRIFLERFEDHFMGWSDNAKPIANFDFRPAAEATTRLLALLNGTIDLTEADLGADAAARIESSNRAHLRRDQALRTFVIRMNNAKPPFDNINARKCFAHAFNYDGYIETIMQGTAKRNGAPMPATLWGMPDDLQVYDYDLDKAKEYYDLAVAEGAPMDQPIEFYTYAIRELSIVTAQVFQADLAKIGVDLKIVNSQWANILSMTASPETAPAMWCHWVSAYYVDPENWLGAMYDSKSHGTWKAASYYRNAEVDELLQKARSVADQEGRQAAYAEAIRKIVADSPDIWVYDGIDVRGVANRVQGLKYCPVGGGLEARWMSLTSS